MWHAVSSKMDFMLIGGATNMYTNLIWRQSGRNLQAIWCQRCPGETVGQAEGLKLGLERKYAKTI
jgi:hypothetical protein